MMSPTTPIPISTAIRVVITTSDPISSASTVCVPINIAEDITEGEGDLPKINNDDSQMFDADLKKASAYFSQNMKTRLADMMEDDTCIKPIHFAAVLLTPKMKKRLPSLFHISPVDERRAIEFIKAEMTFVAEKLVTQSIDRKAAKAAKAAEAAEAADAAANADVQVIGDETVLTQPRAEAEDTPAVQTKKRKLSPNDEMDSFFADVEEVMEETMDENVPEKSIFDRVEQEWAFYWAMKVSNCDTLVWWAAHWEELPLLHLVAAHILATPATGT